MKKRSEIAAEDKWGVEALYSDAAAWQKELHRLVPDLVTKPHWPTLQKYMGKLGDGPAVLKEAIVCFLELDRSLTKLYTYAHLRHDENIADAAQKKNYEIISTLMHAFAEESAWFQPELLALPDHLMADYLASPLLKEYRFMLEKWLRMKKHTLSSEQEKLLAGAGQALSAAHKTFSAISDADFKFGVALDSKGEERALTHGSYALCIRSQDRVLRENAFKRYHKQYSDYENTLCELLQGQVQAHLFEARARKFSTCLDAALFPKNIDTSVYHALIKAVHDKIGVLHRYMKLRKKVLQLKEQHLYDVYVPLTSSVDIKMTYEEAEKVIIASVAPLGEEYQSTLKRGLLTERWVDRYENENKRSGAYSSGCYDSHPYILMNYKSLLRDVFTLAHEAGHSMHSLYSRKTQSYHYSDYPIFLAEVASTFNEDLLTRHLLAQCKDKHEKIFLINQKIEDIRGTLFRQTMFAEFELLIHTLAEQGVPLTPELLKEKYRALNQFYFGNETVIDPEIDIEWARIPHFYYNFYVYQYATGISAALALADKVVRGIESDREAYLAFLKGGSSKYPIEMLQMAGIDMRSPEPVKAAIDTFDKLITELEQLI